MLMNRDMGRPDLCAGSTIAQSQFTAENFAKRRLRPRLGALRVVGRKAGSTLRSSRAVPHPSTNRALRRLTSEVGRDPVHSTRYGRQREECLALDARAWEAHLTEHRFHGTSML